jgi:hypothetical protein
VVKEQGGLTERLGYADVACLTSHDCTFADYVNNGLAQNLTSLLPSSSLRYCGKNTDKTLGSYWYLSHNAGQG